MTEAPQDPGQGIHSAAAAGFQAGADAYERGRPEYPVEAVSLLVRKLGIGTGGIVAEVGAGTGKFTRLLAQAAAAELIAVEPVAAMRAQLARLLPGIRALEGTAERLPLADSSLDAVIAAQAFHWFDGPAALRELRRVLKPGGRLGLIWNVRDESLPWVAALTGIIDPHEGGAPRYKSGRWREAFCGSGLFTPLESAELRHVHRSTPGAVVDRVASISFIAALPETERASVLRLVQALLEKSPETAGRAEIDFPYRTDVFWCSRI